MEKHRNWQQGSSIQEEVFDKSCAVKKGIKKSQIQYNVAFENVPFHEEASEKKEMFHVSRNCLCFINYPADSHSNYPPLSFFSSSPSRWITGVIRMNVCPALNEIVISVVVISVGDMNHCSSVLTSSHPAPGYRQPSHANSLAHRVQFSPSNKAPG